jgi:hypothetical protein
MGTATVLLDRDTKTRRLNWLLGIVFRILGVTRYQSLMNYLKHTAILRTQSFLLD